MADNVIASVLDESSRAGLTVWNRPCSARVSVLSLFFSGGPFAIIFRVVAVIIYTLNAMQRWTLTHISKEVFEYSPSGADRNSSSAVPVEMSRVWVGASLHHRKPRPVCSGRSLAVFRVPMSTNGLNLKAAATKVPPAAKIGSVGNTPISAVTGAFPFWLNRSLRSPAYNHKPSKSISGKVNKCGHFSDPLYLEDIIILENCFV